MDTIVGIPAHPLFVHLTVVAIPLAAIFGIAAVVWPAGRRRLGLATPIVALVAVVMTPLTTSAGESLEKTTRPNKYLEDHTELGDTMIYYVAPLFVLIVLFWALNSELVMSRVPAISTGVRSAGQWVLGIGVVAFAIGAVVVVVLVGHSGAESVWVG